jgi:hypothetical protein
VPRHRVGDRFVASNRVRPRTKITVQHRTTHAAPGRRTLPVNQR